MPYYSFREQWTPLKLIGIRLFIDEDNKLWIKIWKSRRRKLFF